MENELMVKRINRIISVQCSELACKLLGSNELSKTQELLSALIIGANRCYGVDIQSSTRDIINNVIGLSSGGINNSLTKFKKMGLITSITRNNITSIQFIVQEVKDKICWAYELREANGMGKEREKNYMSVKVDTTKLKKTNDPEVYHR